MTERSWIRFCQVLIVIGIAARFYGFTDPWKTNDHYNFGGVWTTTYAECLKSTPLEVSKGIPHSRCWTGEPDYYRAHPPTILFAMWGWTSVFGSSEAAYRGFTLTFSVLNIALIFFIGRLARPSPLFPWLAAAFQSIFLGNIYFGTHLDFISEFTVTFVLLSAWLALRGQITSAGFASLAAGLTAWPGYISFGPLWLFALNIRKGRKRIFAMAVFGFAMALGMMMWLHQKTDIIDFLRLKLLNPGYIKQKEKGLLEPLRFFQNVISSNARLLSPLFAALATYELFRGDGKTFFSGWRSRWRELTPFHHAVLLTGGTGLIYALIGHEYFMVHVFLYLLMTPGLALLSARFIERNIQSSIDGHGFKADRAWISIIVLLFASLYPYGIYRSSLAHDVINSVALISSSLGFLWTVYRTQYYRRSLAIIVSLAAAANVSQTINYRNEPDKERSFCEKARNEYIRTNQPVITQEKRSDAKEFIYCRGIPIQYEN